MRLGIRSKFIAILVIASFLPLLLGLLSIRFLGKEIYCSNKGSLFQAMAQYLARNVEQHALIWIEHAHHWTQYGDLGRVNLEQNSPSKGDLSELEQRAAMVLNDRWPGINRNDPLMQGFMANPMADRIKAFMKENPLFVEAFLTDRHGRLVAMSNKTSDYWQSDEVWWQQAAALKPDQVYVEGIHFDESAGVYTLDVAAPVWTEAAEGPVFTGVLKAVLNAGPLFKSIPQILSGVRPRRDLVNREGLILLELFGEEFEPLGRRIYSNPEFLFGSSSAGWTLAPVASDTEEVVGFAALELGSVNLKGRVRSGVLPMYVVVHEDLSVVMAPFHRQMTYVGIFGCLLVLAFFFLGDLIANRKLIRPLKVLQAAAQQISLSAHLSKEPFGEDGSEPLSEEQADDIVARVSKIHTRDEIEDLAGDFGRMSDRVMNYHAQLEREITAKTEDIQRDLVFAREFQQGLMPETYPQVPTNPGSDPVELQFHHVYEPASSVSGDFFDIQKIDDHSAGIIIVDVMGHGARSALITAIIRTLIQNFNYAAHEPGRFLTLINEAFRNIIPPEEVIFATALYLVVNTRESNVTYCSAGHMAPILIQRGREAVKPLFQVEEGKNQCAIGLLPETVYREETVSIQPRDVLLLYTDGVVEAVNAEGEEFGDQLVDVVQEAAHKDLSELCDSIMRGLGQFMGTVLSRDDICLVAVEAAPSGGK